MRCRRLVLLFLLAAPHAFPQDSDPICEINPVIGCETYTAKAMQRAGERLGEGLVRKAEFAADLASTRLAVSLACRSSSQLRDYPERIAQVPHLMQLLNDKDAYFLSLDYDVLGWGAGMQDYNNNIDKLTSGGQSFDGGPRPCPVWQDFIQAVNGIARARSTSFTGILENAVNFRTLQSGQRYRRYVIARNLTELNAAGCNLTSDPAQLWHDALLIDQPWKPYYRDAESPEVVSQYFAGASSLFGPAALSSAAETALRMPKTPEAKYRYPDGYETGLMDALLYGLEQDDRSYARKALMTWEHTFKASRFEETRKVEAMLVAAYGDDAVTRAGHTVRTTERTGQGEFIGFGPGWRGVYPRPVLFDALARNDPQGYVRAILGFEHQLTDRPAVDAAYAGLVSNYGTKAVNGAGHDLMDLLSRPSSSLPAAFRASPAYTKHYNGGDPGGDAPLGSGESRRLRPTPVRKRSML